VVSSPRPRRPHPELWRRGAGFVGEQKQSDYTVRARRHAGAACKFPPLRPPAGAGGAAHRFGIRTACCAPAGGAVGGEEAAPVQCSCSILVSRGLVQRSRHFKKNSKGFFFSRRPFAGCCSSSFGQWGWRRARRMGFTPWRARCCDPGRRKSRGAARGLVPRSPSARRRAAWWPRQLRAG